MNTKTHTTICVSRINYSRNAALGDFSDSADKIVSRILDHYDKTGGKQFDEPEISDFSEINGTSTKMRGKMPAASFNFVYLVLMYQKPRPVSNYSPSTYRYNKSCHLLE